MRKWLALQVELKQDQSGNPDGGVYDLGKVPLGNVKREPWKDLGS